jgi:hypothetical protein
VRSRRLGAQQKNPRQRPLVIAAADVSSLVGGHETDGEDRAVSIS